uniref:BTB domain-containing protein n=1 Tax=Paramoeba aestuarina TaxID=180227 RepID=A0A6U2X1P7_9EUKA|mmetsp:Transcript_17187/g.26849  ORF Transcript_17187/g.26849 Transcript_17187/m.26849 type:complete len:456 (+) Transcript_17187:67-1434(+)|eukprot:CAMPEP_0201521168 /NCGR_PEP_ID=MMETSP0161_2-20130828/14255_1 /ASSEMBLY_ACC=CAM_ASM_000251 /TAXON_ID=180227 /ORGANISM="Neoparamoeba aestuarina, Strain SoJaBio B1-5/56/2" /LENGTH=455 /DNA_ID=CAMNT_0047919749 /DNA_START=67 /DNA_END=1434 /DNA_ORIENTATION=+
MGKKDKKEKEEKKSKDKKGKDKGKGKKEDEAPPVQQPPPSPGRPQASGSAANIPPPVPPKNGSSVQAAPPADGEKATLSSINMMDEKHNYDVTFALSDGKTINAHSYVLQYRCQKLYDAYMKKKPKGRSRKPVNVDMKDNMNPESFRVIVQFLYADNIDFPSFSVASVLSIVFASHQLELERLARLGEEHLRGSLNLDMVFSLLKGAHELGEARIKAFCMDYAHKNMKDFIKRKDDARSLGVELFQEVVSLSLEEYKEPPPDTTPVPPNSLHEDFGKLFASTKQGDTTDAFVNINGEKICFHRAVLSAHTKPFANAISSAKDDDMSEALHVGPNHPPMEPEAFRSVLKFVYFGSTDISPVLACDCAPFAKRFEAFELQRITESVIAHNISGNNVLPILRVAYLPENMDRPEMASLRAHCLMFLTQNVAGVNLDPLMELDIRISVDILRAWQKTVM